MYELIKSKIFRPRQPWEKNLLVLWFGTFMAGIGFSLVMPFMPLYINTLGTFTHQGETMVVTKKVEENVIPLQKFNCWWVKVPNVLI